ncbi:MAG: MFS transporter, partial [Phycisphaeraceae bacterium]
RGALGAAFGLAFTAGPAIGGYIASTFSPTSVGYLAAMLQLASLGLIFLALKETHPPTPPTSSAAKRDADEVPVDGDAFVAPKSLLHLITFPAVAWMLTICLLGTAAYSVLFPTFPALADDWYGWSVARVGAALSVFGLVGAFVQGGMIRPTIKRLGERATAQLGLAILAAGLLWIATQPGEGGFWTAAILMAIGTGFSVPAVMAMLSLAVSETDQGSVHGLTQSATAGGRAVGYLIGGTLFTAISPAFAYATAGIVAVAMVAMLLAPLAGHKHPQEAKAPETADA